MSNAQFDGRWRLKTLTVVKVFDRKTAATDIDESIKGEPVVATLTRITSLCGAPSTIRAYKGPELIFQALNRRLQRTALH